MDKVRADGAPCSCTFQANISWYHLLCVYFGVTDRCRKIDEPKTPYVRYDAENDTVLGIGGELSVESRLCTNR